MSKSFKQNILEGWPLWVDKVRGFISPSREKGVIVLVAVVLASLLWFVVNLNRNYTIDIKVPLTLGQVSSSQALAVDLPNFVTASISGEGWSLLSVYRDPQPILVDVSGTQINLFEQVRRQFQASSKLRVEKVSPLYLRLQLENKISKKVPVISRVKTNFLPQYNFLTAPIIQPDSIIVTGAVSIIEDINYWLTDSLEIKNIETSFVKEVPLKQAGSLIALSTQSITFSGKVAEFTEGTVTVPVELRNAGVEKNVIFSPQEVKITYLAPIQEFPAIKEGSIFSAYITFKQLVHDSTGFVSPQIQQLSDTLHLKVQQVQPRQVAYFNIVTGNK